MNYKLNFNVPDDFHGGLLTPGVMNEGVLSLNQTCYEYIASSLIRKLNVDDLSLRLMCWKEDLQEPEATYDPSEFDYQMSHIEDYDSEEKEELLFLRDFLDDEENKESLVDYKESLLEELHDLLLQIWEDFRKDTHCRTSAVGENFHVLYNTQKVEDDFWHTFEIFAVFPDWTDRYYHSSWEWNDTGLSVAG